MKNAYSKQVNVAYWHSKFAWQLVSSCLAKKRLWRPVEVKATYRNCSEFAAHHPAGTSVSSVKCDKPVYSASHSGQWGHFFLACGQTNSVENPWISQSSLDLFPKWLDI